MAKRNINFRVGFDMKAFSTSAQNLSRGLDKVGKKMQNVGKSMSMYVTAPIVAMGALSLKAFDEQAKALAQVEAGLKSTGNMVGYTSRELEKLAEKLQQNSLFGDEEILKGATAQLLTFTNIAGVQFERTQQAALDLATRLDGDLKSSSIMLGKALNDPVANLSALSRAGIQFSTDQKQTVKTLVETNRLAEAQTLILNELEKQYGGSAAAAARAGLGPLQQLQMAIGDLSEEFGKIIAEYIIPFADKMKVLIERFKATTPETKKIILVVAGLAAAIGPLIFALGSLSVALGFLAANPIVLAITATIIAIAALVAAFLYLRDNAEAVGQALYNAWVKVANGFIEAFKTIHKPLIELAKFLKIPMANAIEPMLDSLKLKAIENTKEFDTLEETLGKVKGKFAKIIDASTTIDAVTSSTKKLNNALKNTKVVAHGVWSDLNKVFDKLAKRTVEFNPNVKINLDNVHIDTENVQSYSEELGEALTGPLKEALQGLVADSAVLMGEFIGGVMSGSGETVKDFGKSFLGVVGQFMSDFGKAIIGIGVAKLALDTAINSGNAPLAIAAGIALVAAGAVLSNVSKKGIGSVNGGAGGGNVPAVSGGGSMQGENYSMSTIVEISGRSLMLVQEREMAFRR